MFAPLDPPVTSGERYFTLAELRAEQDVPATYTDAEIEPNQELAEQVIEDACAVAFIPRRRAETTVVGISGRIYLAQPLVREIEAVAQDGIEWPPEQVAALVGNIIGGSPGSQLTVTYTHGYDEPPARIRRAAMTATRVWTTKGPVDDRATQIAADGATVNLATPGLQGSVTGIPEVDAAISQYDRRALVG